MHTYQLPVLSDNYIFGLYEQGHAVAVVVDPAEASPVLRWLKELGVGLVAILNTHHHGDHVGGNVALMKQFPDVVVYGGAEDEGRIPGQQVLLNEGDRVVVGDRTAEVFFVPGHTKAHIAYYFPPEGSDDYGDLFCGDTLFAGGCGRLFEGTPSQMVASLSKLKALPDQTRVWCAHEYTLKNLEFALTIEPENVALQTRYEEVKEQRSRNQATVPSILGVEKQTNPFLRWDQPSVQATVGSVDPVQTFARLRGRKDQF